MDATVRILHLVAYPVFSGPLPPTVGLALAQRQLGHQVWLAYDAKRGSLGSSDEEPAAPRVDPHRLATPLSLTLSTKSSPGELWRDVARLRRLAKEVDVVHLHTSHDHALAALALAAVPRVRTFHAARSLEPRFGQRWVNRRAEGWIVRSLAHRERLLRLIDAPAERTATIPGSIDATAFQPASPEARARARRRFGIPDTARVITHVALMSGRGQEELAGALAALGDRPLHVLFVGDGKERRALELLTRNLGLAPRAHFAGYLQGPDLHDAYAAADAAFLAQPGNDASARAALEAMASGLPLLAVTTDPALRELVTESFGYPIPERTPAGIAASLARWLADPVGFERGRRGREHVIAERSFAREAERTLGLYERVTSGAS